MNITQPVGSSGCLWKLRMMNGMFHHSHLPLYLTVENNALKATVLSLSLTV